MLTPLTLRTAARVAVCRDNLARLRRHSFLFWNLDATHLAGSSFAADLSSISICVLLPVRKCRGSVQELLEQGCRGDGAEKKNHYWTRMPPSRKSMIATLVSDQTPQHTQEAKTLVGP
jgi:hypothetical protein